MAGAKRTVTLQEAPDASTPTQAFCTRLKGVTGEVVSASGALAAAPSLVMVQTKSACPTAASTRPKSWAVALTLNVPDATTDAESGNRSDMPASGASSSAAS